MNKDEIIKKVVEEVDRNTNIKLCESVELFRISVREENQKLFNELKELIVDEQLEFRKFKKEVWLKFEDIEKRDYPFAFIRNNVWKIALGIVITWAVVAFFLYTFNNKMNGIEKRVYKIESNR